MTPAKLTAIRQPRLTGVIAIGTPLLASAVPGLDPLAIAGVVAAMLLAALFGPANAVGVVAAMLPLVFVTARIGATEWGLLELALICCAAACAGEIGRHMLMRQRGCDLRRLLHPIDLTIVAGALIVVGLISLEWVADARASANSQRELRRVIVEPLVVILAVRLSNGQDVRRLVARCIVSSGLIISVIALAQVGLRSSGVEVGAVFRPIGSYPHPNNLALYLERVVWVPMALVAGRISERSAVAATGVIALACAATLSRGAILALLVGGAAWLLLSRQRVRRWFLWSGIALAAALVLVARAGGDGTESLDSRGKIWTAAAEMLRDYPITGIGIDQFYQLYGTRYVDPGGWSERYTSHPHNVVLDFWLQLGLAGLVLLAVIIWLVARRARTICSGSPELVSAAMIAGIAGGFAHGLIDNGFFLPDLATFLWLALALVPVRSGRTLAT